MIDAPLYAIAAAFFGWEFYAAFVARERGAHTLSNRVHEFEKRYPKSRFVVFAAMLDVTVHLAFGTPLTVVGV